MIPQGQATDRCVQEVGLATQQLTFDAKISGWIHARAVLQGQEELGDDTVEQAREAHANALKACTGLAIVRDEAVLKEFEDAFVSDLRSSLTDRIPAKNAASFKTLGHFHSILKHSKPSDVYAFELLSRASDLVDSCAVFEEHAQGDSFGSVYETEASCNFERAKKIHHDATSIKSGAAKQPSNSGLVKSLAILISKCDSALGLVAKMWEARLAASAKGVASVVDELKADAAGVPTSNPWGEDLRGSPNLTTVYSAIKIVSDNDKGCIKLQSAIDKALQAGRHVFEDMECFVHARRLLF